MAARFFCDNCGTEVKRNSGRCPHCGRFFVFVRCPQCGYTAEEGKFAKGCPVCGYCTTERDNSSVKLPKRSFITAGKLPLWVYIIALLGLGIAALVLYITVR